MHTQQVLGEYEISTDPQRLNLDVTHEFLTEDSYRVPGVPHDEVECSMQNSLCFGVYHGALTLSASSTTR